MKWTAPRLVFAVTALAGWWAAGRYAWTGRAVVRTLAAEARAKLDSSAGAAASARMQQLTGAQSSPGRMAALMAEWAGITDVVELRRLYESCGQLAEPWKSLAQQEIIRCWIRLDPKSAASYSVAHRNDEFVRAFLRSWAAGMTAPQLAASIREIFGDPRNFTALLETKSDDGDYHLAELEYAAHTLGGMDPVTAMQAWAQLGYARFPKIGIFGLFQAAAAQDPAASAALAETIPDAGLRQVAREGALSGQAVADPVRAMEHLPKDGPLRQKMLEHAITSLGKSDPDKAAGYINLLPASEQSRARFLLASVWLPQDPVAASRFAAEHSIPQYRSWLASQLGELVGQGRLPVPDWATLNQVGDPAMRGVLSALALEQQGQREGPESAQKQWDLMVPQQQVEALVTMARPGPEGTALQRQWDQAGPRLAALRGAALEQALQDSSLTSAWAEQDPVAMLEVLKTHPPGKVAGRAVITALERLAAQDPASANAYVGQMTPGSLQDSARAALESRP